MFLVDTQGIGAATTQHREGLASLFMKQSSAYVYCVKYGETEDLKNEEDYRAIAEKDKGMCSHNMIKICILLRYNSLCVRMVMSEKVNVLL